MNGFALNCKIQIPDYVKPSETLHIRSHHRPELRCLPLLNKCTHLIQLKQVHAQIIKLPHDDTDNLLARLVESLVASGEMSYAYQVFKKMRRPTTFVFNTMVRGYALIGALKQGIELYIKMLHWGLQPDEFTYTFLLKTCTSLSQGKGVHSLVLKRQGSGSESDIYSQTALVSFYANHGDLESARSLFDRMPEKNVVSWTAMITGYVKLKRYNEGLALFHQMQISGVDINELTLVNVLCACAHLGALEMGKWVHAYINRRQIFLNPTLATALIDMYVKCGYIQTSSQIFEELLHSQRGVCAWNAIIGGLAMHGYAEEALDRFEQMQMCGTRPDEITFIAVLSACSHSGLVDKGKELFHSMRKDCGIEPSIKHYGCLADLLGRAGHLDEAYQMVKNMPLEPNGVVWGTLLKACAVHANVELAETAMERLVELEPLNDGNYVVMSNIYAARGRWGDVARLRRFMKDRGILKIPGCSTIEIDNVIHEFMVGDSRHPRSKDIYSMLDDVAMRLKAEGYVPKTNQVLIDASEEGKRQALCHHSEKLAIAFGLISTSPRTPIRVMKNLRACGDCHLATKLISKIYSREIIVRDRNRFHHFKDGTCSCNDYW
ncbi:PREDICTED: pentatricopeptide repeat-containing protein At1g08070, chloroplastic-like [Nelumbo nucifera]|uniref:DYW domain-containing protein n=2 Tax=Nelumbo nucifera TaxID=4432 RepID=A0A822YEB3_NELNU|nr:PREDICTED: pentatricopeptide repeat-containing protein At1g08070, chloroplastic-like [Nelumbo nucifera]DAD30493.1 TPA_asm: hypothetical protein HUJ06_009344 [Nelumbo nucifera]